MSRGRSAVVLRAASGRSTRAVGRPRLTSGTVPAVVLTLGGLGAVPVALAQLLVSLVVIVRLALLGLVARRLSGRPASAAALWSGVVLATISVVIAVAKTVLGH